MADTHPVRRRARKGHTAPADPLGTWLTRLGWGCYLLAALMLAWVVGALVHNDLIERSVADRVAAAPAAWPAADQRTVLEQARAFNRNIETRLHGAIPADATDEDGTPLERADSSYMRALSVDGDSAMARLRIPKISVSVPVYHTTLDGALDQGAGHVYGTALPVGDHGTYSAIAAHSGGVQGMLFTRLQEMNRGDVFYLDVLGGEQGYRIVDTRTVKPEALETSLQALRKAHRNDDATITLITCTPIGVNTDRLLVTAVRGPIPGVIPASTTQRDSALLAVAAGAAVFVIALVVALAWHRGRRRRHAPSRGHT